MDVEDALAVYLGDDTDSPSLTGLERYTDTDASDHAADKRTIATILANDHRGRYWEDATGEQHDNTISSESLSEHTACNASTVRDLIPEIMAEYRLPIGNANGYFVVEDFGEGTRQIEQFRSRAYTSLDRARLLASILNRRKYAGDV